MHARFPEQVGESGKSDALKLCPAARIAFVCEGDAESHDKAFSGIAKSMLDHLRRIGHRVEAVNASLSRASRAIVAVRSFSPDRSIWRARFRYGPIGFRARSRRARSEFAYKQQGGADVVLQIGATFEPPARGRLPYALYCDWNMALSIRYKSNKSSSIHRLPMSEAERINFLQAAIYRDAGVIFTISERLRESFLEDYGIPADRVVTAHAGANLEISRIPARPAEKPPGHRPTILFIGKEFIRKGGDTTLLAFRKIRDELPNARLLILGTREPSITAEPNVEVLGLLRKDIPAEAERLYQAYADSDVFCLPSRHDPFPTVVREAMFYGLPCVTSNIWAMPEMVEDGGTGYTVPPDDVDALADRLLRILRDPRLGRQMGEAGRKRAEDRFTWESSILKMHQHLQSLVTASGKLLP